MNSNNSLTQNITERKKYTQTSIFTYFGGVTKGLSLSQGKIASRMQGDASPVEVCKTEKKKPQRKPRKRRESAPAANNSLSNKTVLVKNNKSAKTTKVFEKRKLPAPIFTDEEDSGEEVSVTPPVNDCTSGTIGNSFCSTQVKMVVDCNKPATPLALPKEKTSSPSSTPSCSSIELSKKRLNFENDKPSNLFNMFLSPKRKKKEELLEMTKEESSQAMSEDTTISPGIKKVNYMNLKIFREFFYNVINSKNLKSLLREDDQKFLTNFFDINKNYQYTCIKLFLWKQIWYNVFKYTKEIGLLMDKDDVINLYEFLKKNDYIETDILKEKTSTLLHLLQLKDLKDIQMNLRLSKKIKNKEALIEQFLKTCRTQVTLTSKRNFESLLRDRIAQHLGLCFKLSERLYNCLYSIFLLNTFSNPDIFKPQDYFSTVVYLNMVFPKFDVEEYTIFETIDEFQAFVAATQLRAKLEFECEKKKWSKVFEICEEAFSNVQIIQNKSGKKFDESRPPFFEKFTACCRYISIICVGCHHLTKSYFYDVKSWLEYLITQDFNKSKRGYWICQLSLIYTQYIKDYKEAAKLLINALENEKDNLSEVQLHELAYRGKVLNKKIYNLPEFYHDKIAKLSPPTCDRIWPSEIVSSKLVPGNQAGQRVAYEHKLDNGDMVYLTVEEKALEHYKSKGFPQGVHCEGNLIRAAFCLYFWDIIYDSYVKGTFVSPMQFAPLDINTKYFYLNRQMAIDKRLKQIENVWSEQKFEEFLFDQWKLHSQESSFCEVAAVAPNPLFLQHCLKCIGRDVLAKIFERLVKNFRAYRSGFPDLIVWNIETKQAKFVEIKSENDKLSIKQKVWLKFFQEINANAEVCHVLCKGSKKYQRLTSQPQK